MKPRLLAPVLALVAALGVGIVLRLFFPALWERVKLALLVFATLLLGRLVWGVATGADAWGLLALFLFGPSVVLAWRDALRPRR